MREIVEEGLDRALLLGPKRRCVAGIRWRAVWRTRGSGCGHHEARKSLLQRRHAARDRPPVLDLVRRSPAQQRGQCRQRDLAQGALIVAHHVQHRAEHLAVGQVGQRDLQGIGQHGAGIAQPRRVKSTLLGEFDNESHHRLTPPWHDHPLPDFCRLVRAVVEQGLTVPGGLPTACYCLGHVEGNTQYRGAMQWGVHQSDQESLLSRCAGGNFWLFTNAVDNFVKKTPRSALNARPVRTFVKMPKH